jgi:N-acetylneuraminate synthase
MIENIGPFNFLRIINLLIMNFFNQITKNQTFFISEIGINHNGDIENAIKLIEASKLAGCNAVKFQKRTPEIATPNSSWNIIRETPWGKMKYIDYKKKIEFGKREYDIIDKFCKKIGILWTASCWDIPSIKFIEKYNVKFHKVASACITDINLLKEYKKTKKPIIISTGMSTENQIRKAIKILSQKNLSILHCNSSYPAQNYQLNLNYIKKLKNMFKSSVIGYSGHEINLSSSIAAVVLGAKIIERHITLDKSMWGTDQQASIEPLGFARLIKDVRNVEKSLGKPKKIIYPEERVIMSKLRKFI